MESVLFGEFLSNMLVLILLVPVFNVSDASSNCFSPHLAVVLPVLERCAEAPV